MDTFPVRKTTVKTSNIGYNENGFPSMKTTANLYNPNAPQIVFSPIVPPKTFLQKIGSGVSTMAKNTVAIPSMFRQTATTQESISRNNKIQELAKKTGLKQTKDGFVFTNPNAQKVLADFANKQISPGIKADERVKNLNATVATLITDMVAYPLTAATKTKPVQAVLKGVAKVGEKVGYPASKIWSVGEGIRTKQSPAKVWNELKKAYETPVPGYKPNVAQQIALGAEQSITPMAVGAGLSLIPVVGKPLSSLYFAAQSANGELKKTGEMTIKGLANVAVDTYFDSKIGGVLEGVFKPSVLGTTKTVKSILSQVSKGGFTEGGTEVIQALAVYGIDYNAARTFQEKKKIMAEAIDYVRNGMIPEFASSFIGGAALIGIGGAVSPQNIQQETPAQEQTQQAIQPEIKQNVQAEIQDTFPKRVIKEQPTPLATEALKYNSAEEFVNAQIPKGELLDGMSMGEIGVNNPELNGFTLKNVSMEGRNKSDVVIDWKNKKIVLDLDNIEEVSKKNGFDYYEKVNELTNNALNEVISQTRVPPASNLSDIFKLGTEKEIVFSIKAILKNETDLDFENIRVFGSRLSGRSERSGFRSNNSSDLDLLVPKKGLKIKNIPNGVTSFPMKTIKWKGVDIDVLVTPEDYLMGNKLTDIWTKAHEGQITEPIQPTKPTETNISGVAKGIEATAIEQGLIDKGYNDLAEYNGSTLKAQAKIGSQYTAQDHINFTLGKEPLPVGLKDGTSLSIAIDYALKTNNGVLMRNLANSQAATNISNAASTLSLSRIMGTNTVFGRIQEIVNLRKKNLAQRLRGKSEATIKGIIKENLKAAISKSKPNKYSWTSLVEEITC